MELTSLKLGPEPRSPLQGGLLGCRTRQPSPATVSHTHQGRPLLSYLSSFTNEMGRGKS